MTNYWKRQREKLGLSQRRLASLLGVSNNTVSTWEKGDAIPELSRAPRLAKVFGVGVARIEREIVSQHRKEAANDNRPPGSGAAGDPDKGQPLAASAPNV